MALTKIDDRGLKTPIDLLDNEKIRLGTGNDLEIYHDGTNTYLKNATGDLILRGGGDNILLQAQNGEQGIRVNPNGAVELYYDNSKKFETTSAGVTVTGVGSIDNSSSTAGKGLEIKNSSTSGFSTSENLEGTTNGKLTPLVLRNLANAPNAETYLGFDAGSSSKAQWNLGIRKTSALSGDFIFNTRTGSSTSAQRLKITHAGNLQIPNDSGKLQLGASQDLQIFHDGTNSIIDNDTAALIFRSDQYRFRDKDDGDTFANFIHDGAVELYHDNNKKLETTSTGATVTGDLEVTGGITSTSRSHRNLIINGAMMVAQRGTSSTDTGYRTVDRFRVTYGGTDENLTQEQVSVASGTTPYTLGFRQAFKITNGNQTGGAGTNDFIIFGYKIEAQDIAKSGWNYKSSSSYVTLSFWIKSSVAQDFKGHLYTPDGTQQIYPFATGSLSADTWTKVTKTIPGHSNITIDNDNGEGFHINIAPFFGTSFTANEVTENAWATYSSATRMKDNTSTWYTTNDATLEITGMQLEVGSVATDFEHLPYCDVMRKCMRYYYATKGDGTLGGVNNYASGIFGFGLNGNIVGGGFRFPEPMRAAPSLTLIRPSDGAVNGSHLFRGVTGSNSGTDKSANSVQFVDVGRYSYMYMIYTGGDSVVQGGGYLYHIEASAEL